ncbi:MAG: hypothetical protein IT291_06115 [Deltaproteobacteria bacterium]|nr:hypothetical protein [Deltaproteobacteria bacterium]
MRIFSWIIATFSLLLIASAFYLGILATTGWHYARLQERFLQGLEKGTSLEEICAKPEFAILLADKIDKVKGLATISRLAKDEKFVRAISWVTTKKSIEPGFKQELLTKLEKIVALQEDIKSVNAVDDDYEAKLKQKTEDYLRAHKEFYELLTIGVNRMVTPSLNANVISIYNKLRQSCKTNQYCPKFPPLIATSM